MLAGALVVEGVRLARAYPRGGTRASPVVLGAEPEQEALERPQTVHIERDGRAFHIQQTHRYHVAAEVLSAATYRWVFTNDFFDVDLGLAWGDHIEALKARYIFYQDHRWLFWRSDTPVAEAERGDVTAHAGNAHMIPAEGRRGLDRAIRWAQVGDAVTIDGYLVTVYDSAWQPVTRSSTSRNDSGAGACEIIWVERFQNGGTVWE